MAITNISASRAIAVNNGYYTSLLEKRDNGKIVYTTSANNSYMDGYKQKEVDEKQAQKLYNKMISNLIKSKASVKSVSIKNGDKNTTLTKSNGIIMCDTDVVDQYSTSCQNISKERATEIYKHAINELV